jgi:hypothetical protein
MEIRVVEGAFDGVPEEDVKGIMEVLQVIFGNDNPLDHAETVDFNQLERDDPEFYERVMKQIESMETDQLINGFVLGDIGCNESPSKNETESKQS